MLNDPKHPRPKRTPPGLDWAAVDAAIESDVSDEQAFFFRCCKLFRGKGISIEPDPQLNRTMDILFRLYYEFQRLSYSNKDAGDMAISTFLRYY